MANAQVERRMTELEDLLAEVLRAQERTQRQVDQTSRELREFKGEMAAFKGEMAAFKGEMAGFREEMRASHTDMNKRWGDLSNKLGTMAEDLVAPGVPRILRAFVGTDADTPLSSAVRVKRNHPSTGLSQEFDLVAACGDHALVCETRSRLRPADVDAFVELMQQARSYLPEYEGKRIIGALGTLYADDSVVRCGERAGLLVLTLGQDLMEVRNSPGFVPRAF